jgi:hypothetical protein
LLFFASVKGGHATTAVDDDAEEIQIVVVFGVVVWWWSLQGVVRGELGGCCTARPNLSDSIWMGCWNQIAINLCSVLVLFCHMTPVDKF